MRQSTSKEDEQPCSGLPTCMLETEMDGVCVCSVAVSRSHPTGQQQRPPSHSRHGQGQTRATLGSGCLMSTVTGPDTEDHRPESENNGTEMKVPSKGTHAFVQCEDIQVPGRMSPYHCRGRPPAGAEVASLSGHIWGPSGGQKVRLVKAMVKASSHVRM